MANILLGPVVGLVTQTSARVLLEVDKSTSVFVTLHNETEEVKVIQNLPAEGARVFQFQGLAPNTVYQIRIEGAEPNSLTPQGRIRTLPEDPKKICVIALSCDCLEMDTDTDMWQVLCDRIDPEQFNLVLHLGDNVYLDGEAAKKSPKNGLNCMAGNTDDTHSVAPPYNDAENLLKEKDRSEWPTFREAILRMFRQRYRVVWGRKYKSDVLATCSNIMILDDHEVRDDLGDRDEDWDPESSAFFISEIALQVYHEYQRQLWDPEALVPAHRDILKNEFFTIHLGPLSVAMVDARTSRAMYRCRRQKGDNSFYGQEQRDAIMSMLNAERDDSETRMWLVGCPLPLLFFTRKFNKALLKLTPDNDDVKAYIDRELTDLEDFYEVIRRWKTTRGVAGDILVLAGDVHVGGFTDIHYKPRGSQRELVCRQVTTSPIRNSHWGAPEYAVGVTSLLTCTERQHQYKYKHYDVINACNFLEIQLDFSTPKQMHYELHMVQEHGPEIVRSTRGSASWDSSQQETDYIRGFFKTFNCFKT